MEIDEIKARVEKCVHRVYENDQELIEIGIHENAINSMMKQYLSEEFKDHKVDCEYNKHIRNDKTLNGITIRPDVVVHHRKTDELNMVYIELKTSKNKKNRAWDIKKVKGVTISKTNSGEYGYMLGVFIDLYPKHADTRILYFMDGKQCN